MFDQSEAPIKVEQAPTLGGPIFTFKETTVARTLDQRQADLEATIRRLEARITTLERWTLRAVWNWLVRGIRSLGRLRLQWR